MEVRYKREVNHNYMILDAPSEGGGYECRMLASNTIEGLLRFRVRQYEDKREFYYEITSRQPLNRLLEQRKINGGEIRSILLSLSQVLSKIEEYLLKEEQILLEPEFIYIRTGLPFRSVFCPAIPAISRQPYQNCFGFFWKKSTTRTGKALSWPITCITRVCARIMGCQIS